MRRGPEFQSNSESDSNHIYLWYRYILLIYSSYKDIHRKNMTRIHTHTHNISNCIYLFFFVSKFSRICNKSLINEIPRSDTFSSTCLGSRASSATSPSGRCLQWCFAGCNHGCYGGQWCLEGGNQKTPGKKMMDCLGRGVFFFERNFGHSPYFRVFGLVKKL